jgi:hypothetical protein
MRSAADRAGLRASACFGVSALCFAAAFGDRMALGHVSAALWRAALAVGFAVLSWRSRP